MIFIFLKYEIFTIPLEIIKSDEKNYNFEKDTLLNYLTNLVIGNNK